MMARRLTDETLDRAILANIKGPTSIGVLYHKLCEKHNAATGTLVGGPDRVTQRLAVLNEWGHVNLRNGLYTRVTRKYWRPDEIGSAG